MINEKQLGDFYRGKRVFVTGHTGFKGTWLCRMLLKLGATVYGYSLKPPTKPALFDMADLGAVHTVIGDVRDMDSLFEAYKNANPQIVLHLAAQPLVIESYKSPRYTYETNVMGTVNLLECVRRHKGAISVLNVTTDKVYFNDESGSGFTEDMPLDGFDPYSNSKSCSELVTHSYYSSFFKEEGLPVSTARAGNVIGGGDFAENRIVPDCIRAAMNKESIKVRNPYSVRPFQHVLEPLYAYLVIAMQQSSDRTLAGAYNVGPDEADCVTTGRLCDIFCEEWQSGMSWENISVSGPHEAGFLRLDCAKLKKTFGIEPVWNIKAAIGKTVEWAKGYIAGESIPEIMDRQIGEFLNVR